ncbi:TerB family tellurite resistance protein [Porticoccus sp.]|uniref:tellurite resistance TerB family protein n=1 Tax=Porticoccus sp. TaxID=2024853 RepID=UPI003F6A0674
MIDQIKQFFSTRIDEPDGEPVHRQQLAAAALMVEVMVIDRTFDEQEQDIIRQLLETRFSLPHEEIETLVTLAHREVNDATSLFQFTRLINDHFNAHEKRELVENLWRVAYADSYLDKHEEALIRRISDLLYVSHTDFIQAKHRARQEIRH